MDDAFRNDACRDEASLPVETSAGTWLAQPRGRIARATPDPMRAAIYARFSTSQQKDTSIERQEELCLGHIRATGRMLMETYLDRARSGASASREGLDAMLKDAVAGRFGVLVVENVDRLARDLGILSTVYKKLLSLGIEVHQAGRGKLHLTDIAVQGLMGDEGRRILAERTRFSKELMAREGRVPMGPCYGYEKVIGRPGERGFVASEVATIRRIFNMRIAGVSPRQIAFVLNRDGVPGPSGGAWTKSAIRYVLENPLYAGMLVYKRHRAVKDPDTGQTSVYAQPRADWIVKDVPMLAVVDPEVWQRAQALRPEHAGNGAEGTPDARSDYLLSRLARCPTCGGNLVVKTHPRCGPKFTCGRYLYKRTCANVGTADVASVDRMVMGLVAEHLLQPGFVEAYAEAYDAERVRRDVDHAATRAQLQRRIAVLDRRLKASFMAGVTTGISTARAAGYRADIESELTEKEEALARLPPKPRATGVDRTRMTSLRDAVATLSGRMQTLRQDEAGYRLRAAFREVIDFVLVSVNPDKSLDVSVSARIGGLLGGRDPGVAALTPLLLSGHVPPPLRGYRHSRRRAVTEERIAAGAFALSDADWQAIRPLVPERHFRRRECPEADARATVEAAVCNLLARVPWKFLATTPERGILIYHSAMALERAQAWQPIASALKRRDPDRFAALLDRPLWKPRSRT